MLRRSSRFPDLAVLAFVAALLAPVAARGQACCAGSGALTPGRLGMHEKFLVGGQLRVADVYGSTDGGGHYASSPPGASEYDFEQDAFGAMRVLGHGQLALLVPLVETRRQARTVGSELGGGLGDINASARWDFHAAGESRTIPGIGLLAGVTFPTGTPPEDATRPLATDATGVGAFQGNVGLALEQTWGSWLVNATVLAAARAPRTAQGVRTTLGAQITTLAAVAYSFPDDSAVALVASYAFEGDAKIQGSAAPDSGRRLLRLSLAGTYPFSDVFRLQGSLFFDPPMVHVDQNQPTTLGLTLAVIRTWS